MQPVPCDRGMDLLLDLAPQHTVHPLLFTQATAELEV